MANDLLHIKDGYYFDVPKSFWQSNRKEITDFPEWYVRLDPQYQDWEAKKFVETLRELGAGDDKLDGLVEKWKNWQHKGEYNLGWPFDAYIDKQLAKLEQKANAWIEGRTESYEASDPVQAYLAVHQDEEFAWLADLFSDSEKQASWRSRSRDLDSYESVQTFSDSAEWSELTLASHNADFHGKVLIPQPFAQLRNAYERQSGFAISRYMIVEVVVAILVFLMIRWLGGKLATGESPKGRIWNLIESLFDFVRDQMVVPAMGESDAKRFMPFFWTLFFFVLFLNMAGMIPFVGAPTSMLGTTGALALVIFGIGVVLGVRKFGVFGYLKNICPSLGLPVYLAVVVVPLLWAIEFLSLLIKHFILAIRLLANMVAGHLVLLGILGLAVGSHALTMNYSVWAAGSLLAVISVVLLSFLELFVAFLQAAIFTFLSALFIGSSIHHH